MGDGAIVEHAPQKTLLMSPKYHMMPQGASNERKQDGVPPETADEDNPDPLTQKLAGLELEHTKGVNPMLLEATIHEDGPPHQLQHFSSWASLGFTRMEQVALSGPLFIDNSGI